jgi:hypothetical protein
MSARHLLNFLASLSFVALLVVNASSVNADSFATTPYPKNVKSLPRHYVGHNPEAVYRSIQRLLGISKSEFETTDHYKLRLSNAQTSVLLGSMRFTDEYAFQVDPDVDLNVSYDADNSVLRVVIPADSFMSMLRVDNVSNYRGSNAFGVSVDVSKSTTYETHVEVENTSDFNVSNDGLFRLPVAIPLAPKSARSTKSHVRVLAVCRLVKKNEAYTTSYTDHTSPTIDDPHDVYDHQFYLFVNVDEFVVYNVASGKVLSVVYPKKRGDK